MSAFFEALKNRLWAGSSKLSPSTPAGAPPTPQANYQYLDRFGFYMHPEKPGYFCGRCKSPLTVHKDGWQCTACAQFYRSPDQGGGKRRT